jgi:hypothetical protein
MSADYQAGRVVTITIAGGAAIETQILKQTQQEPRAAPLGLTMAYMA